ncbi:ABC transporter permease [Maritimibacter alkaliphilus]|uniref:ABC transporter permease n=1 Tax=Maritimibacter alkaliphilus TaxID=404236 RepID=UPI001C96E02B|nr:ABC transporter permease [Maritimibacter alkaliphilus]MBY6093104.1 ABC transporter permease [Maritimibacter alkaliphilus]
MKNVLSTFLRRPAGIVGLTLLGLIVAMALLAPVLFPVSPWDMSARPFVPPGQDGLLLGSDTMGRDIASGVWHGASVSLIIGIASALTSLVIGVTLGCVAGYFGGWFDLIVVRITEVFQTIPNFVMAIVVVAILSPSMGTIIFAIGVVSWPSIARLTRAQVRTVASREFVAAARCQGQITLSIVMHHILPNAFTPIIVAGSFSVAAAILIEASLSFMGLGDPNHMSWGYMIGAGRTVIRQAWWMSVFPGIAILVTVVAINLVGEALNDALNPRISRQ